MNAQYSNYTAEYMGAITPNYWWFGGEDSIQINHSHNWQNQVQINLVDHIWEKRTDRSLSRQNLLSAEARPPN